MTTQTTSKRSRNVVLGGFMVRHHVIVTDEGWGGVVTAVYKDTLRVKLTMNGKSITVKPSELTRVG